jgi:hypothetical protein
MELIARAVELAEANFPGDPLAEACRFASPTERRAVLCIVRSRHAMFDQPATQQEVIAALREMVRGKGSRTLPANPGTV